MQGLVTFQLLILLYWINAKDKVHLQGDVIFMNVIFKEMFIFMSADSLYFIHLSYIGIWHQDS
jgi:hypothetical protein